MTKRVSPADRIREQFRARAEATLRLEARKLGLQLDPHVLNLALRFYDQGFIEGFKEGMVHMATEIRRETERNVVHHFDEPDPRNKKPTRKPH